MDDQTPNPTPPAPPPHAPPTGPKRKNVWVTVGLAIGIAFVIGQGLKAAGDDIPSTAPQRSPIAVEQAAAPPAPTGPVTSFSDGTYEVGVDVEAGKYKTTGPSEPGDMWTGCYYARLSGTDGELGSILANENFEGQNTVTIKASDVAFEASGDCVWTKVG